MELVKTADLALTKDTFLRHLLGYLAQSLEEAAGLDQAEGLIALVGQKIAEEIYDDYRRALGVPSLDHEQLAAVLIDLMARVGGDFYLQQQGEHRLVFGNRACPFGKDVEGRPALCMMTTNLFGVIAAESNGYARVETHKSIAKGDTQCQVVVSLTPDHSREGREFFRAESE